MSIWSLSSGWEDATVTDVVAIVGVEVITAVAFFFLGAMAGSFLNVVLYRMPRRRNLLWPPSACPHCGHRLALADNVPVLSWLRLRGHCRYCQANISSDYLRVEVLVGTVFLSLLYLEVHTGGLNLPLRMPNQYGGALWTIWYPRPDILSIYLYHLLLTFFLLSLVLFVRQGDRLPGALVIVALLIGVLVPVARPTVQQVPWKGPSEWLHPSLPLPVTWVETVIGLAVGGLLGLLMGFRCDRPLRADGIVARSALPTWLDLAVVLAIAGTWLGWQAVISVAMLSSLARLVVPSHYSAILITATTVAVQLVCWRLFTVYLPWWPGPHTSLLLMVAWAVLAVTLYHFHAARQHRLASNRRVEATSAVSGPTTEDLQTARPITPAAPEAE